MLDDVRILYLNDVVVIEWYSSGSIATVDIDIIVVNSSFTHILIHIFKLYNSLKFFFNSKVNVCNLYLFEDNRVEEYSKLLLIY